jgi:Tfp pilus assembly protein PilW
MKVLFEKRIDRQLGFTLVETIVYVAMLALILLVVVNTVISISSSYASTKVYADIDQNAATAMERIVREIRGATSIDSTDSTLGSSPGRLVLNTTDASGNPTTVDFYLNNGILKLNEGGSYTGPLTASTTDITTLEFQQLSSGISTAVRVAMTISATEGHYTAQENFYDTVILRNSY